MSDTVSVDENVGSQNQQEFNIRATYLSAHELKLAASLLYQAYHDDPVFLDIFIALSNAFFGSPSSHK